MKKITKGHFLDNKNFYLEEMREGKVFIYPTDTVLGIGCIVSDTYGIDRIFELKQRESKPLLIIIPHIKWVDTYAHISRENKEFISKKLPGAYSFVVKLKDPKSIYSKVHNNLGSIGVRIPDNWFSQIISELGMPFITTSVNLSGEPSCLHISNIPQEILDGVDYVIESNDEFLGRSSTLIDMREEERVVLRK